MCRVPQRNALKTQYIHFNPVSLCTLGLHPPFVAETVLRRNANLISTNVECLSQLWANE